jgi:hypothetical protein
MVQKSLSRQMTMLENLDLENQTKLNSTINQNIRGFLALTIRHYLLIDRSFDQDEIIRKIYLGLKKSMDLQDTLKETEIKLKAFLEKITDPANQSGMSVKAKQYLPKKGGYEPPL